MPINWRYDPALERKYGYKPPPPQEYGLIGNYQRSYTYDENYVPSLKNIFNFLNGYTMFVNWHEYEDRESEQEERNEDVISKLRGLVTYQTFRIDTYHTDEYDEAFDSINKLLHLDESKKADFSSGDGFHNTLSKTVDDLLKFMAQDNHRAALTEIYNDWMTNFVMEKKDKTDTQKRLYELYISEHPAVPIGGRRKKSVRSRVTKKSKKRIASKKSSLLKRRSRRYRRNK